MKSYYNLRDSYRVYKKISKKPIDTIKYLKVVNLFMKFLISTLLETGEIVLPERLGRLEIGGKKIKVRVEEGKIKGLAPDWIKTKELWNSNLEAREKKEIIYHFNEHTNGVRYSVKWSKNRVLVENKTLYDFILTRTNKRNLSKLIKNNIFIGHQLTFMKILKQKELRNVEYWVVI